MASRKEARPRLHTQTLTFIETDPGSAKDKNKQQLARTHGIRNAFRNRYQSLQDSGENFRQCMHSELLSHNEVDESGSKQGDILIPDPILQPAMATIDPFETLAVDAYRLTELLNHHSARQASEPVFSVNDQIDFRHFHNVFDSGLQDPALAHALCLTLKFASNGNRLDEESLL
ncbi:hypothetical protein PRZ48_010416 [Zasmidium cellare]|uniref:Uncharacterized protein n=1 Tax=Zasmidium cellare TaxID=395010 RepID=A0ABR0E8K3_ZASCE|nr:hypothetical protein PRZ48_010416 [Zasmidium cellare]